MRAKSDVRVFEDSFFYALKSVVIKYYGVGHCLTVPSPLPGSWRSLNLPQCLPTAHSALRPPGSHQPPQCPSSSHSAPPACCRVSITPSTSVSNSTRANKFAKSPNPLHNPYPFHSDTEPHTELSSMLIHVLHSHIMGCMTINVILYC